MGSLLVDGVSAAYVPLGMIYASDWACVEAQNEGLYVCSGCAISANASTLTSVSTTVSTSLINKTSHGLVAGDTITMAGIVTTTGITNGTLYYVSATSLGANSFRVAATSGGTAITFGGSNDSTVITVTQVGKVDMSAGVIFSTTTELNVSAVTAASTTVASLASSLTSGQALWVLLEIDGSGVLQFTSGSAATVTTTAGPVKPALTAARVPVAWLYVPFGSTTVDALLSTSNSKAKIQDARRLVTIHASRVLAKDTSATSLTNPTTATTLLASAPSIPANSLSVGDVLQITASGFYTNNAASTTMVVTLGWTGASSFIIPGAATDSLTSSASSRRWSLAFTVNITAIGASANGSIEGFFTISAAAAGTPAPFSSGGGANGSGLVQGANHSATWDSTAAQTLDLKVAFGSSSTGATIGLRNFTIIKIPA